MNNQNQFNLNTLTGDFAIKSAVKSALDGKTVSLELGHEDQGEWKSKGFINFGLGNVEGAPCLRYCGNDGKPNGEASSSVIATWYKDCMEESSLVERIKHNCKNWEVFLRA